ncbi:hypothetical protein FB2170_13953 [Maribacter sp. HTCC2170]|nr:hypothetical protein FB2170_13953 [Maribacter sp. HTCC2170]
MRDKLATKYIKIYYACIINLINCFTVDNLFGMKLIDCFSPFF